MDGCAKAGRDSELFLLSPHSHSSPRTNLRLVKRRQHGEHANGKTGEEAACEDHLPVHRASLDCTTKDEDDGADKNGVAPTEPVRNQTCWQTATKGTEGERTDNEALVVFIGVTSYTKKIRGGEDTGNDAQVVAKQDAAQRGKAAAEEGVQLWGKHHPWQQRGARRGGGGRMVTDALDAPYSSIKWLALPYPELAWLFLQAHALWGWMHPRP